MTPAFGKLGRFVGVGAVSTLLYAALGLTFSHALGASALCSTIAAYSLCAVFSYVAHRRITFRSERAHVAAVPRFAVTTLCGFSIATGLTVWGERAGLPYAVAVAAACVIVPAFNFIVLDRLVFSAAMQERRS